MGSREDSGGGDVLGRSWLPSGLTSGPVPCTGESGLGKSTLINSLFLTNLYEDRQVPDASGKSTPRFHPCRLPNPTAVQVFPLWWPWPLPVSSGCILFLSIWGLWWPLVFSETVSSPENTWGQLQQQERSPASEPYAANVSVPLARTAQTLTIERRGVEIEEGGIKVKLTLVDTPGFGDSVDCSDW